MYAGYGVETNYEESCKDRIDVAAYLGICISKFCERGRNGQYREIQRFPAPSKQTLKTCESRTRVDLRETRSAFEPLADPRSLQKTDRY